MGNKDLIILGMGPSRIHCPFDAEVWGLHNGWKLSRKKLDKIFLTHRQVYSPEGNPYFNWEELNRQ